MLTASPVLADLKATFQLQILGVKKNPQSPMYTQLGVLTKGTVIEVNVSELGMVTAGGKVVFGKYAQVTNNPENDGCINAVLRASHSCLIFHRTLLTTSSQLSKFFSAHLTPCFHTAALYRLIVSFHRLNVVAHQRVSRDRLGYLRGSRAAFAPCAEIKSFLTGLISIGQRSRQSYNFGMYHVHENIASPQYSVTGVCLAIDKPPRSVCPR